MYTEIKKLKRSIYLAGGAVLATLLLLLWFFTHIFTTIQVKPVTASVLVDGKELSATGSGSFRGFFSPGNHLIRIEASGYKGTSQTVNLKMTLSKKFVINLEKNPEPLSIASDGKLLSRGNDFNDIYYLDGQTLTKAKVGIKDDKEAKIAEKQVLTNPIISDVDEIIWSPNKDLALLRKTDEVTIFDFKKYDFINQTELPWGQDIGSIAWSPDNSKIAYYYAPPSGEKSLIFSNITNTEPNRMLNFNDYGINNPLLRWSPSSEWLLIIPRNEDSSTNKIYIFNAYSRAMTEIADTGNQLDAMFSPDGNKIIYSTYSKDSAGPVNSVLSIMNQDGSNKRALNIRAELQKMTWCNDSQHIIVASYDPSTKQESVYRYSTDTDEIDGFILKNFAENLFIHNLVQTNDNKIIIYQDNNGINAVNVD